MDKKAFQKLSCGLYLISTKSGDKTAGCVVNTLMQVTSDPLQLTVTVNKDNCTAALIQESGRFAGTVCSQSATMELIGTFGFNCSKDIDKFADFAVKEDRYGIPYVCEQAVARFSCKVTDTLDAGTHIIFLAEVEDAEVLNTCAPMTYAYYHIIKNGVTPPKASSYVAAPEKGYRCKICGYILEADTIPDDFVCPVCGRGKDQLEKL